MNKPYKPEAPIMVMEFPDGRRIVHLWGAVGFSTNLGDRIVCHTKEAQAWVEYTLAARNPTIQP